MTLEVFTIGIAVLALLFSGFQFFNKHRPLLCVTSLKVLPDPDGELMLWALLANLGEIPAKRVRMKAEMSNPELKPEVVDRSLGVVFPGQTLRTILPSGFLTEQGSGVNISLMYCGPIPIGLWHKGFGYYHTYQPLVIREQGDWVASGREEATFS